jgi:copper chaperone CopZ
MSIVKYFVPNISCSHCVHTIQTEVGDLPGVRRVKVDATTKLVEIDFVPPATEEKIKALLEEINYPVSA